MTVTIACSIGSHGLCSGHGVDIDDGDVDERAVRCECPCHSNHNEAPQTRRKKGAKHV